MNVLSKFGFLLITALAIGILILKLLTDHHLLMNTWLYTDLSALAVLFGFIVAIAVIFIFSPLMKNLFLLLITFVLVLVMMYLFIAPAYLGGV